MTLLCLCCYRINREKYGAFAAAIFARLCGTEALRCTARGWRGEEWRDP